MTCSEKDGPFIGYRHLYVPVVKQKCLEFCQKRKLSSMCSNKLLCN